MRRKEREIIDRKTIEEILTRSKVCRIAISGSEVPQIFPMNYGYSGNTLYFHSAPEGRKIELIKRNPEAGFEIEDYYQIIPEDTSCGWTTAYRSLMGSGRIEILTERSEKERGLDIIMAQHGRRGSNTYRNDLLDRMVILRLSIEEISCKQSGGSVQGASRELIETAKQLKALAETGLKYQDNPFDQERYARIRGLSTGMMALLSTSSHAEIESFFSPVNDYPTPKIDVRGLVVNETGHILMVRESVDGKWTLPGGWADIGSTPSESVVKEVKEESGLDVTAERLLAIYDKRCHPHPPSPYYIYKLVFLCRMKGGDLKPGFDILDVGWFRTDKLPELSTDRILAEQISELARAATGDNMKTIFD
ncbi:MAG: NUDIX hydrolase N-terminal domain-containing protein [Bacteroidales bacterium]|jgi:nitroimidazol reductase NimA-like FMN-containing flavoprotein (pyridoxamine 5'-phosphate oxidase superfamily)/ADP-ribose pyrophosphatase YjhB (NUDIX family)|nr:NUDIX hydrolase N-terminal domain-containing protein [Bacteroidales bacterium]